MKADRRKPARLSQALRGGMYEYRYYNCSKFCRIGSAVCPSYRIRTHVLDEAVLAHLA